MVKQAKAAEVEGQDNEALKGGITEEPKETTEEPIETPKPEVSESKQEKEAEGDWKQKYLTLEGINKKTQERSNKLEKERSDFTSLSQQVSQIGQTLDLVVEQISASFEVSEELQEKAKKQQQAREVQQKAYTEGRTAMSRIQKVYEAAGLKPDDEALTPAKEAFDKGEFEKAFDLTVVASLGNKTKPPTEPEKTAEKPAEETKKPKPNLKSITSSPASKSIADMTSDEKIKAGLERARLKQG